MARLAARHQSSARFMSDSESALIKNNEEAADTEMKVSEASIELKRVKELVEEVKLEEKLAKDHAEKTEQQLTELEEKRS